MRTPEQADRWTWLILAAYTQLRLARPLTADTALPWERRLPAARLTPTRIRRGFLQLLPVLGTPASPPKPCGRSPGRPEAADEDQRHAIPPFTRPPPEVKRRA